MTNAESRVKFQISTQEDIRMCERMCAEHMRKELHQGFEYVTIERSELKAARHDGDDMEYDFVVRGKVRETEGAKKMGFLATVTFKRNGMFTAHLGFVYCRGGEA